MKRLILPLLIVSLMVSVGASNFTAQQQQVITIGLIAYQYETTAWPLESLVSTLVLDMQSLPPQGNYLVEFVTKLASTAAEQVTAIQDLVAQGVDGLMIVPVADTATVQPALEAAIAKGIPVMVLYRPISGLSGALTAYVGLEPFQMGMGWGVGARDRGRAFMAVVTNLNDPVQSEFIRGLSTQAGDLYKGTIEATTTTVFDLVSAVVQQTDPLINYLIVADPALIPETIRAVSTLTTGGDRLVKIGSYHTPVNGRQLMGAKQLHFVATQDTYNMFQKAALELKAFVVNAEPLQSLYVQAQIWGGLASVSYHPYPYDYYSQILFTFNRFW